MPAILVFCIAIGLAICGIAMYVLAAKSRTGLKRSNFWGVRTWNTMVNDEVFAYANNKLAKSYYIMAVSFFVVSVFCVILGIVSIVVNAKETIAIILAIVLVTYALIISVFAIVQGIFADRAASEFLRNAGVTCKSNIVKERR